MTTSYSVYCNCKERMFPVLQCNVWPYRTAHRFVLLIWSPSWHFQSSGGSAVCGRFHPFSPHNLTDTQWPWHTAIYVRSPPDPAAKPRPRGATMSVHQGASEESTFWLLACSGALLSQRSVLVAAPCVLDTDTQRSLEAAQVRVVLGTQRRAATDELKTQRLQVRRAPLVQENRLIFFFFFREKKKRASSLWCQLEISSLLHFLFAWRNVGKTLYWNMERI